MDDRLIAIPLTAFAVLTTVVGGALAQRMAHSLPTVIALSGGIVVAVALFDVSSGCSSSITGTSPPTRGSHGQVGTLGALGLSAHSFLDGLAWDLPSGPTPPLACSFDRRPLGFFIYMGATDLLPEAHEHASWGRVGLTLLGFGVIFGISLIGG